MRTRQDGWSTAQPVTLARKKTSNPQRRGAENAEIVNWFTLRLCASALDFRGKRFAFFAPLRLTAFGFTYRTMLRLELSMNSTKGFNSSQVSAISFSRTVASSSDRPERYSTL